MTSAGFRRLALSLPQAIESAHMGHPDFRVRGKIFATLGHPRAGWGMVKLTPEQQEQLVKTDPAAFQPVPGAWGARGCTNVRLRTVKTDTLRQALLAAWRNTAPKLLVREFGNL
jgi:hypothetical protein